MRAKGSGVTTTGVWGCQKMTHVWREFVVDSEDLGSTEHI